MEKSELIPLVSVDIETSKFDNNSFYVHQKKFGYRLKISNESYQLLEFANGKNNLNEIKTLLKDDDVSIEFLYDFFYEKMAKYGIVINKEKVVEPISKPSYLKLSFIVIPPHIVDLLTPSLKFLFIPKVMYSLLTLVICLLTIVFIKNYELFMSYDLKEINWLYFGVLSFISVTFHEFGHASSAKYFGAKHGGIGGGFYLFSPVYFADVSDIWKLSRFKRIIVNISGMYFESIMASIYIVIGLVFDIQMLVIIGTFIFLHSLWNLNPFLRNDGYWVLSDGLNYPNLSKNSLLLLKDFVLFFFKKANFSFTFKNIFLVLYALVNQSFAFVFLYYSISHYGLSLITFPYDLVLFIKDVLHSKVELSLNSLFDFFIPFLFYYLTLNLIRSLILRKLRKKRTSENKNTSKKV